MEWARYSPDPWAPDSRHPNLWATDSRGRLTLGRAVELLLGAKAAEGRVAAEDRASTGLANSYLAVCAPRRQLKALTA
jgi:hypothetical protein